MEHKYDYKWEITVTQNLYQLATDKLGRDTYSTIAHALNTSERTIYRFFSGTGNIDAAYFLTICNLLQIAPCVVLNITSDVSVNFSASRTKPITSDRINKCFKSYREKTDFSRLTVSNEVGISYEIIRNIERNRKKKYSLTTLMLLCEYYQVDINQLFLQFIEKI